MGEFLVLLDGVPITHEGVLALAGTVRALLGGGSVGAGIRMYSALRDTENLGTYWNEYFGRVVDALRLLYRIGGPDLCAALRQERLGDALRTLEKENDDASEADAL